MSFYAIENIEFSAAEPGPCPVCRHPTGDCVGDSHYKGAAFFKPKRPPDPGETFSLPERVYEDVVNPRTGKVTKKLLYARGTRVRPSEAKRLGFL